MYKRRKAREQAVEIIFENMFNKESVSWIARMAQTYREIEIIPFGKKIAKYAIENQEEIDNLIKKYSERWSIDRISKVSLAILKMAISEILFISEMPTAVTINEAIEISKLFVEKQETGFIHGVLGAIIDNEKIKK
ncbi:MAG: transcription antitermination factor NusB [Oscillospiraceae bacterium]|nr:transcription antitermination factor NusB [Oscillospiraceae bacterium]